MHHADPTTRPHPYLLWSLVCTGITAISFASILIRLADAPSLAIATYRVGLASVILTPYCALKFPLTRRRWNGRILGVTCLSGFFLALHFAFWIRSLQMTSVASSATLVSTTPLFVAIFAYFCLGERLSRHSWIGILLVLAGSGLIAGSDFHFSKEALVGDLLAVAAFQNSLSSEPWLIVAAIVTVYIVLGVLYESYIHPITILSTLPSAGVGAI